MSIVAGRFSFQFEPSRLRIRKNIKWRDSMGAIRQIPKHGLASIRISALLSNLINVGDAEGPWVPPRALWKSPFSNGLVRKAHDYDAFGITEFCEDLLLDRPEKKSEFIGAQDIQVRGASRTACLQI